MTKQISAASKSSPVLKQSNGTSPANIQSAKIDENLVSEQPTSSDYILWEYVRDEKGRAIKIVEPHKTTWFEYYDNGSVASAHDTDGWWFEKRRDDRCWIYEDSLGEKTVIYDEN